MRPFVFLFTVLLAMTSCNGQETSREKQGEQAQIEKPHPRESWKVEKEVDENGNIIRMDSMYTWSFSSNGKDISPADLDSLMARFGEGFRSGFPSMFGDDFFTPFPSDSTFFRPFFSDSLLMESWQERHRQMEDMMRKADSIHRSFAEPPKKMNRI